MGHCGAAAPMQQSRFRQPLRHRAGPFKGTFNYPKAARWAPDLVCDDPATAVDACVERGGTRMAGTDAFCEGWHHHSACGPQITDSVKRRGRALVRRGRVGGPREAGKERARERERAGRVRERELEFERMRKGEIESDGYAEFFDIPTAGVCLACGV